LADAFARIVKAEIGLEASIGDAKFIGVYEHLYDTNVFGEERVGTHYVVLAHELNLGHRPPIVSDGQHRRTDRTSQRAANRFQNFSPLWTAEI
jgi:colanic acid biosynthesis protein WcaH